QLDLHANVRRDLMAQFGYTYSQAIDAASGNNGSGQDLNVITNPYVGWRYDSGPSVFDRTSVAFVNFVYDIPAFKGSSNRLLKTTGTWLFTRCLCSAKAAAAAWSSAPRPTTCGTTPSVEPM